MKRSYLYDPEDWSGVTYKWDGPLTTTVEVWTGPVDLLGPAAFVDSFDVEQPGFISQRTGEWHPLGLHDYDVQVQVERHHRVRCVNHKLCMCRRDPGPLETIVNPDCPLDGPKPIEVDVAMVCRHGRTLTQGCSGCLSDTDWFLVQR